MLALGHIHGHVGQLKKLVDIGSVFGGDHVTDARLDREGKPTDLYLALDHVAEPAQDVPGIGDIAEDDPELVAPQSGQPVRASKVGGQPAPDRSEQPVAVLVAEGVVDLLEAVEIDDGDRRRLSQCPPTRHLGLGSPVEEHAVGKIGERVVLGQIRVELDLAAQPASYPERDSEQDHVEGGQPDQEVAVEGVKPAADVGLDRRIRQVHLEDADPLVMVAGEEWKIDLDRLRARLSAVVAVGVDPGQAGYDGTVGGVQGFVLGALMEPGAVVGEHDCAGQITEAEPLYVATGDGITGQPVELGLFAGTEASAQRPPVEQWLDGGVGHQLSFRAALGQTSTSRLGAVASRRE